MTSSDVIPFKNYKTDKGNS